MVLAPVGFDLDMTLIDSRATILTAFQLLASETGVAIAIDQVERRLGLKLEDELQYWFGPAGVEDAAAVFRRHYIELAKSTQMMPGASAALAAVAAGGVRSIIITAKHASSVAPCLEATGLRADQLFVFVHGAEKATVLRKVGAAIYVGDTPADMSAAVKADAVGVGVTTGSFGPEALTDAGARVVLSSLEDFPAWYWAFRAAAGGR
jgi:phosphoglycolate phosphatase